MNIEMRDARYDDRLRHATSVCLVCDAGVYCCVHHAGTMPIRRRRFDISTRYTPDELLRRRMPRHARVAAFTSH